GIVQAIRARHRGRAMLIGDGSSDLEAGVAVDLFVGFGGVVARKRVAAAAEVFIRAPSLSSILPLALGRAALPAAYATLYHALIVRSGTPVDREMMQRAVNLQVIGRAGLAFDNIDVAAATERGIIVLNTPDAYSLAAAEHTLALLLALCRHVPAADASVRA